MMKRLLVFIGALLCITMSVNAQVSLSSTSTANVQNFDGMNTSTSLPVGWKMTTAGVAAPDYFSATQATTTLTQVFSTGSPATGGRYNWAPTAAASDRAVGPMTSGSYAGPNSVMVQYSNGTGGTITALTGSFDLERYRTNSTTVTVQVYYSTDGSTWIEVAASAVGNTEFPVGANAYTWNTPLVVNKSLNITALNIAPSANIYLRWQFSNTQNSNSQGLGLDNVSILPVVSSGADTTPPTAVAYSPLNGATTSTLSVNPTITFSENVQKGTGNIMINNLTDNSSQLVAIGSASVTINGAVLAVNGVSFGNGRRYAIRLANTSVQDLAGNAFGGISDDVTWSFSFNANPVATDDSFGTQQNRTLTANVSTNDNDPNSSALTYSVLSTTSNGTLAMNAQGVFTYTPTTNFTGSDTFTYSVSNAQGFSATATVNLNIVVPVSVIISQYYEGLSTNKWIEITNTGSSDVNLSSSGLQLALYAVGGDTGNISFTSSTTPSAKFALSGTITANGSVVIGNTSNNGNNSEIGYLIGDPKVLYSNSVINFNGNDGVALLDVNNAIVDAFGQGINAKDVSYVRKSGINTASDTFQLADWNQIPIATVQEADDETDPNRLGVHIPPNYPACAAPLNAASGATFTTSTNQINLSFTAAVDASEYLVIRSNAATLTTQPLNGTVYNVGNSLGNGFVIARGATTTIVDSGLDHSTTFYYFIYPFNNVRCTNGPLYNITLPLTVSATTATPPPCVSPTTQASTFTINSYSYNFIQGAFGTTSADAYLVVMSTSNTVNANPVDGVSYVPNETLGNGVVIKIGAGGTFQKTGLEANTTYHFAVFAVNSNCVGGPLYNRTSPLLGNQTTMARNTGNLNFYYGNLHAHSSYSDGNKDDLSKKPLDDYQFASQSMHMDFLGISEHNHTDAGMNYANWKPGLAAAVSATNNSFVGLYGMEWGTISGGGHVIVYGIDSLIGWQSGQYDIYVGKGDYRGTGSLTDIINRHGLSAFGYLAHPNTADYESLVSAYDSEADRAIVGSAVESGPAFSTNTSYSDAPSPMSYLSYFRNMLAKGYHVAPAIDHDNHNMTFGRMAKSRLVVLSPSLTENDLLSSMKNMRFYATQDYGSQISFSVNQQPMGSVMVERNAPTIEISALGTSPTTNITLMYGVPGSGVQATALTSANGASLTYTHNALANSSTVYYYAEITSSDGSRSITAPIWYTRNDEVTLPVELTQFTAKAIGSSVQLAWRTQSESKNDFFTLERSTDGRNFAIVTTVKGAGTTAVPQAYSYVDREPYQGVSYYRLRQTDFDGRFETFAPVAVKILTGTSKGFNIYPNPVQQQLRLDLNTSTANLKLKLVGVDGSVKLTASGTLTQLEEKLNGMLSRLAPGMYVVDIQDQQEHYQSKLMKQ